MTQSKTPTPAGGDPLGIFNKGLSDADFARLSRLVYDYCGIKLPPHKKSMLESRLRRRLRVHGLQSFEAYCDYVFSHDGMEQEFISLIDVVTTNKTDFFREPAHFNFLAEQALPALIEQCGAGIDRPLQVWSAGCSSGEEPYTLAMVLSEFGKLYQGYRFNIIGTDISTRVLEHARLGIYALDKVAPVPEALKKRYLLKSRDSEKPQVRIVPELRSLVSFLRLNFMEDRFDGPGAVDIIFCRNVIIYFDRPTQQAMLERLCSHLAPGRFIFMGHSETLHGMNLPLTQVSPSVYRRK